MNKKLLFTLLCLFSFLFILASSVEAKRFGGGYSFGGKKSYSSPFKQKSSSQKSFSQQKASATNQQRKQQMSSRGGLMGMLGGLALGGLLGALFFGGAFENFNFFDLIIIGGLIWAVMWFLKRKTLTPQAASSSSYNNAYNVDMDSQADNSQADNSQTGKNATQSQFKLNSNNSDADFEDNFSSNKSETKAANNSTHNNDASFGMDYGNTQNNTQENHANEVILPTWFDQSEFLNGARFAYTQLQEAWENADLQSIRGLTTDSIYDEISKQLSEEPSQGKTRVIQLNAELIDFNELDEHSEASVLFDALLDETDSPQGRATQVRELWHFVRKNNSTEPTWYLDGLQQLD